MKINEKYLLQNKKYLLQNKKLVLFIHCQVQVIRFIMNKLSNVRFHAEAEV